LNFHIQGIKEDIFGLKASVDMMSTSPSVRHL